MKFKFYKTKENNPPLNKPLLCRSLSSDKTNFIYEIGETIETTNGIIWLDETWGEMGITPEEWCVLPQPEGEKA